MLIAGLDIATTTGLCMADLTRPRSEWVCTAIIAEGENGEFKADDLVGVLFDMFTTVRPAFAAIEMPLRNMKTYGRAEQDVKRGQHISLSVNPGQLQLATETGAVVGLLRAMDIPWGLIAPATWRSHYFGKGFKPQQTLGQDKRAAWKEAAVDAARLQKIALPRQKGPAQDAAEAVAVAATWEHCTQIASRYQKIFMQLRADAPRRASSIEKVRV